MSQRTKPPPLLPAASSFPSGDMATHQTLLANRSTKSCTSLPALVSQSLTVWSALALARSCPPGEYASPVTQPLCPERAVRSAPDFLSHNRTSLSSLPEASSKPVGLNAREST